MTALTTLTVDLADFGRADSKATLVAIPSVPVVVDEDGATILSRTSPPTVTFTGSGSLTLVPTDLATDPTGFTYTLRLTVRGRVVTELTGIAIATGGPIALASLLDLDPDTTPATYTGSLANHLADPTAAHAASAISYAGAANLVATDVEGALDELASRTVTLLPISGETTTATTARINAALTAANPNGTRRRVVLNGDFSHNGPLIVYANTDFDTTAATLTLVSGSSCNGIVNQAVQNTRRVMDAVTTASSTTLTSATAAFVAGDVGKTITVWNPAATGGRHVTTIASVTNSTTAVLNAAPTFTGSAQYASIGSRDANITLRLGRLVREASNYTSGSNGWLSHHVRLRHVDNLEISAHDIVVTSGKYAVNVGDCTDVRVGRIYASSTASDVFHVQGPSSGITVDEVVSDYSGDDIVSLTGGDFTTVHQLGDCQGDITDVTIRRVFTRPGGATTRAVLILAGRNSDQTINYKCARITVGRVDSQLVGFPVMVGGDAADNNTQGGSYEDLNLCANGGFNTTTGTPPATFVRLRDNAVTRCAIGPVRSQGASYDLEIGTTTVCDGLTLTGISRSRINCAATTPPVNLRITDDTAYGVVNATGFATSDRRIYGVNDTVALTSGTVMLTYFRPDDISAAVVSVTTFTRGNASGTPTLARYGLYEQSSGGDLTLVASTANDTTLWAITYAGHTRTLSASVRLSPLKSYALGCLFVGSTAPQIVGRQLFSGSEVRTITDRLAGSLAGQSDLPASITFANIATAEGKFAYARMNY